MRPTCSQCSDEYRWNRAFCPRCGARNERSPALIAIRLLALSLVVMAIALTLHLSARRAEFSGSGNQPMPNGEEPPKLIAAPAPAPAQDPKFGSL